MLDHVHNRGNGRMRLFSKAEDWDPFERVVAQRSGHFPVDLLAYCLMPDLWHPVMRARTDASLGRRLGWVGVTHVRRHHEHYHKRGAGYLYHGHYKSFPVAEDDCFLTLCRQVEAAARARVEATASRLGLACTLRGPGRARKGLNNQ